MAESSLLRLLPSRATPRCPARRPLLPKPCRGPAPAHPPPPPGGPPRLCHVRATPVKAHAVIAEKDGSMWWEKNVGQNMIDVDSPEAFLDVLNQSGDRLVIVEFYNTWCASCRGLFPKLCKIAEEHPEITFVKVKFDENKPMCKRLNVRVLPYFHFYHGSEGLVEFFSCSLVQFQKIKDAIALHNTPRHVSGPPLGVGDLDLFNGPYPTTPRASSR